MTYQVGDKVRVVRRHIRQLANVGVGMEGEIKGTKDSLGKHWFLVFATNKGPLMKSKKGTEKQVYAWEEGNKGHFLEEELEKR